MSHIISVEIDSEVAKRLSERAARTNDERRLREAIIEALESDDAEEEL